MELSQRLWQGRLLPAVLGECLAAGYHAGLRLRGRCYDAGIFKTQPLDVPVISIGNLSVGGTGKTPVAMALARWISESMRVAVVSRGYKRDSSNDPLVVSDGASILCSAKEGGDEPYLMATRLPGVSVVVGSDRYEAASLAVKELGAQVVLLDDGFQNRRIRKDLELLLVDAEKGFGNGKLLPAGPLREPLSSIVRANMVVVVRKGEIGVSPFVVSQVRAVAPDVPVETLTIRLKGLRQVWSNDGLVPLREFLGVRVAAFCGVGNPDGFFRMLEEAGMVVAKRWVFGDHHRYSNQELAEIVGFARESGMPLVTTAKDMVNLPPPPYPSNLFVAELEVESLPKDMMNMVEQVLQGDLADAAGGP